MLPSEARMMTSVWIPSENSLPKVDIAVVFWLYVNPFFQRPNVNDKKPGEQRDSTKPSDKITVPAGPSQSVTDDLPNSQIESNEVVGPSCTTKGDCVVTSSPLDPQRESKLHTTIPQPQR
ncbi:hypothetical protein Tco_0843101 [Tanacetum coccineum]|uniref:Uncharacterized protein n=1 Tax=Tanacetum coccineum TaxID=301880 RepID=A0ABQ5B5G3_9ASTR